MRIKVFSVFIFLMFLSSCSNSILKPSGWLDNYQNLEKDILELVNDTRAKGATCGNQYYEAVQPLIWNDMLAQAALNHSTDMAKNGFLSHKGSDGSDPVRRLSMVGYKWVLYGENIGQGYRTAEEAVREWLKSTGHCKNIMNSEFKEAGSAYAKSGSLRIYWTLVFGTSSQ